MFTERQIYIVGLCANPDVTRTTSEISEILNVSERTVVVDIKEINEELAEDDKLICRKGKVYIKKPFSNEAIQKFQENSCEKTDKYERDRIIVAYLAFVGDYVSLEEIAEHIYLSKTGLYKYIKSDWRLKDSLEFDSVKGTRLKGVNQWNEEKIRRFISRNFIWKHEKFEFLNLDFDVPKMVIEIENIYDEYIIISGRTVPDVVKDDMVNYLAVTIIRKKTNNNLCEKKIIEQSSSEMKFISGLCKKVENKFHVKFTELEKELFCGVINSAEQIKVQLQRDDLEIKLFQKIVKEYLIDIMRKMNIKFDENEDMNMKFSTHLYHLKKRMEQNVYTANPDKREISGRFPWATAIVKEFLLPKLGFKVQEIEISSLILYTEIYLKRGREQLHAYFVTRSVPGRVSYTLDMLRSCLSKELSSIEMVPFYKYNILKKEYLKKKAVFITTEPDVAIDSKQMILIRHLMEKKEEERNVKLIRKIIKNREADEIKVPVLIEKCDSKEYMSENAKDRYIITNYEFLIEYNFVLKEESSIKIFKFSTPIEYRDHIVKGIVRCNLCPEKTNPYLYEDKVISLFEKTD